MQDERTDTQRYRVVDRDGKLIVQQWRPFKNGQSTRYEWIDVFEHKAGSPTAPPAEK